MIQVYRIENKEAILFKKVCRCCAIRAKSEGMQITYDLYLSERYPDDVKDCDCQLCGDDFKVDGRKVKKGDAKTDMWSIC
ncbi:hypothetical protein K7A41_00135 [Sphingobacterium sp. InxBP1]|uniref:hypothetical protein n=1 Tax=Sphingobacterium sp. InxBP1 TaxID=2870328 RepID=UPI00224328C1|nr:hypothetical protein [Sphingobacterium sp. InxBP1]MCW8309634.1 hypothetical protein [Sphingobacterium sp. InxBP1]